LRDNLELFELVRDGDRPTIALGMGEFGTMSRVLAPRFGGFLTFASLRDAAATAPGQPTLDELLNVYRFRSIGRATKVYGIMGWPVGHSLSPLVHNGGFGEVGHDGVYVPMPIAEGWEPFKATLGALLDAEWLGFAGASVTLPHKEHLVRFAREDRTRAWRIDALAKRIGAANTLVVGGDGECRVLNTDARGVIEPLAAVLGGADALRGVRVSLLGAGGAARAAAVALVEAGADVSVSSRTFERAETLAGDVRGASIEGHGASGKIEAGEWGERCPEGAQVVVNCTPVGMAGGPADGASPLDETHLARCEGGCVVFDTVYTPRETPLLALARARGLRTIEGVEMFIAQAVGQFEAWTANRAPIERFRAVLDATV
jgi:3-dehydroquinate dehydratase/shikimate dehydrogenase